MKKTLHYLLLLYLCVHSAPLALADAGNCLYGCETSLCYDFSNKSDWCVNLRAKCERMCSNKRSYGAIAYSATDGGYGWSYGWDDQKKAESVAMKNCSAHGSAYKSTVWYYNSCGAVAADGKIVTWGTHLVRQKAERIAMAKCAQAGG
jgi:hypothetical protein